MIVPIATALIAFGFATASQAPKPHVRLAGVEPLAVRGVGFHPRERVVVTIRTAPATMSLRLTSSRTGSFTARFGRSLPAGSCGIIGITAVGARGDRAAWKSPPRPCGAQLAP